MAGLRWCSDEGNCVGGEMMNGLGLWIGCRVVGLGQDIGSWAWYLVVLNFGATWHMWGQI